MTTRELVIETAHKLGFEPSETTIALCVAYLEATAAQSNTPSQAQVEKC